MKKLMIMIVMMVFGLSLITTVSYAKWMSGQSEHSFMPGEYKSDLATAIIGANVKNKEGDFLGKIRDLMIDPQDGGIAFAVLSQGGVLGIPMKFAAIPFSAFTPSDEKNVYLLDMTREKLAKAPGFNRGQWADVANQDWKTNVYKYYGLNPRWGESYPMAQNWGEENSFHQIVGTSIKNQQGEELGKIRDMAIDSQGHMSFAVLSYGGFWGMGGKLVAVPFSALNFDQAKKNFVLNATKEMLDYAPAFKVSDLSNKKWVEDVYRFFGQRPYWTE